MQIQAENTKKRILDSVVEILQTKTYDDMSILEICGKADISVGAFYHHFENKASLIVELYRDVDSYFVHDVYEKVKDMEPLESVCEFLREQCQYGIDTGWETSGNVYKAQMDNGSEFFMSSERGIAVYLKKLLDRCVEEGVLKEGSDTASLRDDLLIITRGIIYNWCVSDGRLDMLPAVTRMSKRYLASSMA